MAWKPAPIIGGAYKDDARPWTCQDTVNYLVVMAERQGGRSPAMLRGVPGWGSAFCDTGTGKPIRGARDVEGLLLVVSGNSLFKVSAKGLVTRLGTIPGVGRVFMSHNQVAGGNQVAIANGLSGYVFDTRDSSLVQITDDAFPGAISFDFIDGYITGIDPARRFAFHSNLAAATDYNALDRYEAEGSPDKLVGQIVDHREWWLFSERTIEPFVNTGAATNTFQRASNTMIEVGCASGASIAQMDSSVFWVGNDGIVYRANGYTPTRVSTHAVEQALARCNLSQCFALTFEDRGHKVYYLTCPDGQTWGYDASSGEWHRRQSERLSRWRINTLTRWNGRWIAGDYTNGKLYLLDWDIQQEDDAVLERRRVTGVLHNNQNRVTVDGFQVVIDTGQPSKFVSNAAEITISGHLPDALVGEAAEFQYDIAATFRPVIATITSGALPTGLTMDHLGHVTGSRVAAGDFSWTIAATDALGNTRTLTDSCAVLFAPPEYSAWRYKQIGYSDGTDYSASAVDDSAWPVGPAPFGQNSDGGAYSLAVAAHTYDDRFSHAYDDASQGATLWQTGTTMWLRRTIELSALPSNDLRGVFYVDQAVTMWINGVKVLGRTDFGDSGGGGAVTIPVASLVIGDNILALKCEDEAVGTHGEVYFDMIIEAAP